MQDLPDACGAALARGGWSKSVRPMPHRSPIVLQAAFASRHGVTARDLLGTLDRFAGLRVLVVGDVIIDEYVDCVPLGVSREDGSVVLSPSKEARFLGGAGIVAAHARALGAEVTFLTVAGADEAASFAAETLDAFGVDHAILADVSRPTTRKQRFRVDGRMAMRLSHLRLHDVADALRERLAGHALSLLPRTDLLLFSDFNYGCLPQRLVAALTEAASAHGVRRAADSQASSQRGDIARFAGMDLVTPTEREARLALQNFESGLVDIAAALRRKARAAQVAVTLGAQGLLLHARKGAEYRTDRLPAFNTEPKDVSGAGDCFFAASAMALAAGADPWCGAYLGALAAACKVGRAGNTPIRQADIAAALSTARG
jgi:rfaE bifunctional protein kinase chain/domain